MSILLASVAAAALAADGPGAAAAPAPTTLEESSLRELADRCGSGIAWLRDTFGPDEVGGAFNYTERQAHDPPRSARDLLDEALARAREERRPVLWYVYRVQGGHMYRSPILDDYMDQVIWSDPALVEIVAREFVPLRTRVAPDVGASLGLVAWDVVEPMVVFLAPDGGVIHRIDRIRTFDPRWFAAVIDRVLARHGAAGASREVPAAARVFATPEEAMVEATRGDYYRALDAWLSGDDEGALAGWRALAEAQPESPFAWRAAANLLTSPDRTPAGAARHAFEWPYGSHLPPGDELPVDTRWRRTPEEAESVAENAVRWLLRMQRGDGSWNDSRYAYWSSPDLTPNAWMAITALAGAALAEWRDLAPAEIDEALLRADDYLFRTGRLNAGQNEECYAHAYRLLYLDRLLAQTEGATVRGEILDRMRALVARLGETQVGNGQWSHEYPNAFATAVVLESLQRAAAAGVAVPEALLAKGLDGLAAARFDDGSFAYGGTLQRGAASPGPEQVKNSSGRMPLCEAALFRGGRSDVASLARALSTYQRHWDRLEKVAKCDFHTDGELAGFFFFHDLYHATEAMDALPEGGRIEFRGWFVARLASLPEIDGSFLDDHEIGKSCSTAYALLALANCLADGGS